jgi:hypothetical protein
MTFNFVFVKPERMTRSFCLQPGITFSTELSGASTLILCCLEVRQIFCALNYDGVPEIVEGMGLAEAHGRLGPGKRRSRS